MQKCARMLMCCARTKQMREDSASWSLQPLTILYAANTFVHHKASRRWTWHTPNGQNHDQFNYISVRNRVQSGVNVSRTRNFPGADIGSYHNLLMTTLHLHLKRISKPKLTRLKIDIEKLKDPNMVETFKL